MLPIRKSWSHSASPFGDHKRTVLAGMKRERSNPREIEGKQALFVVNLPPRKMAGIVSEGMLFDIGYPDGITPVLAVPESRGPDGPEQAETVCFFTRSELGHDANGCSRARRSA